MRYFRIIIFLRRKGERYILKGMKKISADEYFESVVKSFPGVTPVEFEDMTLISEKLFRIQWFNRLHFNSHIAYADNLGAEMLISYTSGCLQYHTKNKLSNFDPKICNAVVICESADRQAIDIALKRPRLNMIIDVFPVVVDLENGEIYYYNGPMFTRLLYNRYEREYIDEHFGKPLRALKNKLLPE